MKTYYIFRHGETRATLAGRGYGFQIRSAHIIEEGKPAMMRMGGFLKNIPTDHNVSSRYNRCKETAQIITEVTGKEFAFDNRVNEFFFETFGRLRFRLRKFIEEMESSDYETILICTHGACISGITKLLTKGEYSPEEILDFPPPGILLKIKDGKIEKWDFN